MNKKINLTIFVSFLFFALYASFSFAADLSSTNFIIRDPVIGVGAGFGSSTNFQMFGSQEPTNIGYSTSLNFIGNFGFLYFPFVQSGTLSGSATGSTIDLTWTASLAARGFAVDGYNIGQSSSPGGPYVYTSVGNFLNYSFINQPIGTYYFVLQTLDPLGNVISTSSEISVSVVTAAGGGGGGSGSGILPTYPYVPGKYCKIADFDCDGKVNIRDLSILLYYVDKSGDVIKPFDLSEDGEIDLRDASIMFYYWDF